MLRSVGALSVIVLHASAEPLTEQSVQRDASWIMLVCNVAARFAVPVFVILSGMGLTLSTHAQDRYPRFLSRRLSKIIPAYLAWSIIYMLVFPSDESITIRTAISTLLTGHASSHLYFVPAIVRLYLLYPILSYLVLSVPCAVAGCCAISWSMIWLAPMLTSTPLGALIAELLPLRWIGYFSLGIGLAHARSANAPLPMSALARARAFAPLIALGSLGCMIAIVRRVIQQSADIEVALGAIEPLILPYSVSVLLWSTGLRFGDGWVVRGLTFVSKHSYAVYLCHQLVLHACAQRLDALDTEFTPLAMFSAGMALCVPLALAAAVLSDRAERYVRRRFFA